MTPGMWQWCCCQDNGATLVLSGSSSSGGYLHAAVFDLDAEYSVVDSYSPAANNSASNGVTSCGRFGDRLYLAHENGSGVRLVYQDVGHTWQSVAASGTNVSPVNLLAYGSKVYCGVDSLVSGANRGGVVCDWTGTQTMEYPHGTTSFLNNAWLAYDGTDLHAATEVYAGTTIRYASRSAGVWTSAALTPGVSGIFHPQMLTLSTGQIAIVYYSLVGTTFQLCLSVKRSGTWYHYVLRTTSDTTGYIRACISREDVIHIVTDGDAGINHYYVMSVAAGAPPTIAGPTQLESVSSDWGVDVCTDNQGRAHVVYGVDGIHYKINRLSLAPPALGSWEQFSVDPSISGTLYNRFPSIFASGGSRTSSVWCE